jgi:hypothetical protein
VELAARAAWCSASGAAVHAGLVLVLYLGRWRQFADLMSNHAREPGHPAPRAQLGPGRPGTSAAGAPITPAAAPNSSGAPITLGRGNQRNPVPLRQRV